jgi:hypothetical protein
MIFARIMRLFSHSLGRKQPSYNPVVIDRLHLRQLDPFLREKRLHEIDMDVLWSFIHARRERDGVVNATINRALEIVRRVLTWLTMSGAGCSGFLAYGCSRNRSAGSDS